VKAEDIPHPAMLAAILANRIYFYPDPEEADRARALLLKLISPSVLRGGRMRRGRPKNSVSPYYMRLLWKMSYCLVRQVVEVSDFLRLHPKLDKDRPKIVFGFYPWIRRIDTNVDNFLSYGPSRGSLALLGQLTGISVSSLEKMRLRSKD